MALYDMNYSASELMQGANFDLISDKLDAVNLLMRAIGVAGVDSLDSGDLDAEDASKMIDVVSHRLQYNKGGGWWFNREGNWNIAPDSNGEVSLPNNTLAVLQCYAMNDRKVPMTMRAGKLYSTWNHTFDMRSHVNANGAIRLTLVVMLPFEHLPPSAMQAIAYQAACEFITSKGADSTKLKVNAEIARQSYIDMQSEQSAQKRTNMFVHNPTQRAFGIGAGGYSNMPGFQHGPYNQYPERD
ncbi:putative tail tubular protein A [Lelliottia phage phD2B]|uniref:Putative tail tubular protein A n=1 Tax=Lelliottia phage phD2B TaxID=1542498 RepID=A0A088FWY4_9CAUD|nr:putative tail tubular protein A [Lelliottia phage phD2B]AIM51259.1 putative tail tubular protein A [Lelliottia phage phD2B]